MTDINSKEYNNLLSKKEDLEENELRDVVDKYDSLYPHLLDPLFNYKIYKKKEFNDLKYDEDVKNIDIITKGDELCNAEFELSLHQTFVRNYLSSYTPYKSLMLYHGLGTGKTCSAISICEEMRDYMRQTGLNKKIIIVASPNVQDNFKLQLFDERKLVLTNNIWTLKGCTGNRFLKEINPTNMSGLRKEKIIRQVKKLINQYYKFMGYIEFTNYVNSIKNIIKLDVENKTQQKQKEINAIKKEFTNRLIVIDEVQNIRSGGFGLNKVMEENFEKIIKHSKNLKLLFLSATPMYNTYKEIIWLINLMNMNDGRSTVNIKDIFNKDGSFQDIKDGGKELFIRKTRGYISFIRGENPFSFPYRIYPSMFNKENTLSSIAYPKYKINNVEIKENEKIELIDIYVSELSSYQKSIYEKAINLMGIDKLDEDILDYDEDVLDLGQDEEKGLGWTKIDKPLQTLNIVYPVNQDELEEGMRIGTGIEEYVGSKGLSNIMDYDTINKSNYKYKPDVEHIFSGEIIGKYSHKFKSFIEQVKKSKGIVLVYSQYIDGGCVPLALALEELGLRRYGDKKSLFTEPPTQEIDSLTMLPKSEFLQNNSISNFKPAKYAMITGDSKLSPNNSKEVNASTNASNKYGEDIKVIIISKAGAEGIDFKYIRQIHIIEPWYNMSRIEQIIGRGVRFCSHKDLPFEERNVEIYLYATKPYTDIEPIDLYVYRNAERKLKQIGNVTRVMKENAVDCMLNIKYNIMEKELINKVVKLKLSSGIEIDYKVGDKPYSNICDYMEKCEYKCNPNDMFDTINIYDYDDSIINKDTYNENYIKFNIDKLIIKIKNLFRDKYVWRKADLKREIKYIKPYPDIQIDTALNIIINDNTELIKDMLDREGRMINIGELYLYQPIELEDETIGLEQRKKPIEFKREKVKILIDGSVDDSFSPHSDSILTIPAKQIKIKLDSKKNHKMAEYINMLYDNYNLTQNQIDVPSGDTNWYKHTSNAIIRLGLLKEIQIDDLNNYVIEHIIDTINDDKLKELVLYLYNEAGNSTNSHGLNNFKNKLMKYIESNYIFKNDDTNAIFLLLGNYDRTSKKYNKILLELIQQNGVYKYRDAILEDNQDDMSKLQSFNYIKNRKLLNNNVGIMDIMTNTMEMVFKIRDFRKRNKGARCDQAKKDDTVIMIRKTLADAGINFNIYSDITVKNIKRTQLCCEQELIMRHFNNKNINNKVWFMNFITLLLNIIS